MTVTLFSKLKIKILGVTNESVFIGAVECNTLRADPGHVLLTYTWIN